MTRLAELRAIVGNDHARTAVAGDTLDGVRPRFVATPGSVGEVSELLRLAGSSRWSVAPAGSGTKRGWGNPPTSLDLVLNTRRLDRMIEHSEGDLVVSAEAGMTLDSLQTHLEGAGQMLALDPEDTDSTLGGLIAANASGPRRFRYGTVRDLLIGITIVLADGTVAKSGGKVVKNVAGYDLGKLFTGSLGTLGVIVGATFRLHPRPATSRLVKTDVGDAEAVGAALRRILRSSLVPSAINLLADKDTIGQIGILFEGIEPGAEAQAKTAAGLLQGDRDPSVFRGEAAMERWRDLAESSPEDAPVTLKVTCLPAELPDVLKRVNEAAKRCRMTTRVRGQIGNGVLLVGLSVDETSQVVEMVTDLRNFAHEGSVVVLEAPVEVKRRIDTWGSVGDALPLMRKVKEQFDPAGVLNPGRFVGRI